MDSVSNEITVLVDNTTPVNVNDTNPIQLNNDLECQKLIHDLLRGLKVNNEEKKLLKKCRCVVTAEEHETINFGPGDLLAINKMAMRYPTKLNEILGLSQYMMEVIDFNFDESQVPQNLYLTIAQAYGHLTPSNMR